MKELWTGIHHQKGDEIYEVRFKTNDFKSYKFVQDACREALDTNWTNDQPYLDKEEDTSGHFIKINDNIFNLDDNKLSIIYKCPYCEYIHSFKIKEMEFNWNTCGWFTCQCGHKVHYEKI